MTINRTVTIDCAGTTAILNNQASGGITISAQPSDVVTLRNLIILGPGSGASTFAGVDVLVGQAVHLENVHISGFSSGVSVDATNQSQDIQLSLRNCDITDSATGVQVANTGTGKVFTLIEATSILNSGTNAVGAGNGSRVIIKGSDLLGAPVGVIQSGVVGGGSTVTVFNSTLTEITGAALQSESGAAILSFSNSFINVGTAFSAAGGLIFTGTDNIAANSGIGSANGGVAARF